MQHVMMDPTFAATMDYKYYSHLFAAEETKLQALEDELLKFRQTLNTTQPWSYDRHMKGFKESFWRYWLYGRWLRSERRTKTIPDEIYHRERFLVKRIGASQSKTELYFKNMSEAKKYLEKSSKK